MVNMELVHGLERAAEIIKARITSGREKMKDYEETCKELFKEASDLKSVIFNMHLVQEYEQMYMDYKSRCDALELAMYEIEEEIEKEMSVDIKEAV